MDELEHSVPGSQAKVPPAKKVELLIRTWADAIAPVFAPVHSRGDHLNGIVSSTRNEPAKGREPKLSSMTQDVRTNSNYDA
jgi:hypothetical protein